MQGITFTVTVSPAEPTEAGDSMATLAGDFVNTVVANGYTVTSANLTTGDLETFPPTE